MKMNSGSRRAPFLALAWLLVMAPAVLALRPGPADAGRPGPAAPSAVRAPAADQLAAARSAEATGLSVGWHGRLGTPASVRGADLGRRGAFSGGHGLAMRRGGDFGGDAVAVLDNLSSLYGIRDAAQEFKPHRTDADPLGFNHVRLRQQYRGLPVVGGDLIVHFNRRGNAYEVNGAYVPDLAVPVIATLTADEAVQQAVADLAALNQPAGTVTAAPILCVLALGAPPALAYQLVVSHEGVGDNRRRWRYWIDAATGAVLRRYNDVPRIPAPTANGAHATITGSILAGDGGGATAVTGWRENSTIYYLHNTNRWWQVYNAALAGYPDAGTYAHRAMNDWGQSDRAGMSLARNFDLTQQYFHDAHNRRSFDDQGVLARAYAHVGANYANAYWDGTGFYFGDGDGTTARSLAILDICAHEYTHAVTEFTAGLIYMDEPGALNESFSDILGACVEFAFQSDGRSLYPGKSDATADWLIGEDAWLASPALRDMRNPGNTATVGTAGRQPSRYHGTYWYSGSGDNGGVHINSGVQNFFFYLLSEGGSGNNDGIAYQVSGIGITNAARVAFRALTVYGVPYTSHVEARRAWLSAAEDLNPAWAPSVQAAWNAVGVYALTVSPGDKLVFRGPLGGPFNLISPACILANYDSEDVTWSASHAQAWVSAAAAGVVPGGGSAVLPVSINSAASALPRGTYTDTLVISNQVEGTRQQRQIVLQVGQVDYFTEEFPVDWEQDPTNPHLNDLAYSTLTFTPDSSVAYAGSYYRASRDPATCFPSPTNGYAMSFDMDNPYTQVNLAGGKTVWLYGVAYSTFYVGVCGYITFGSGDSNYMQSFSAHFNRPRISALFKPHRYEGSHTWTQLTDRVVVTFHNISGGGGNPEINFQYELFFDGTIRITYLGIGSREGLAGLSRGMGIPADFVESDLSAYGPYQGSPDAPDTLIVQPLGGLSAQGRAGGPFAPDTLVYTLSNTGAVPLAWTVAQTQNWVTLSATGGTLAAGAVASVTVALSGAATGLGIGSHVSAVIFSNALSGATRSRSVTLDVKTPAGNIAILDSLAPQADSDMPFGPVTVGLSRTARLTITNTDAIRPLVVQDIAQDTYPGEDFNDGQAQGWVPDSTQNWQVVAGEYVARPVHDGFMVSKYERKTWSNTTLRVRWWWKNSGPAILLLRASADFDQDVGSAYGFQIADRDQFAVFKQVNGVLSWLRAPGTIVNILVGPNDLTATAQGSNLSFYANGTLIWQGVDPALKSGRIGLGGALRSGETHIFDNVRVWESLPSALGPSAPAVSPFSLADVPALPLTLAPGAGAGFNVTYAPGLAGHDEEMVRIRSHDEDVPEARVTLSGAGMADDLRVLPETTRFMAGHPGGPFGPDAVFMLSNAGPASVTWTAAAEHWLDADPASGTLAPGASTAVTVRPNSAANALTEGLYASSVMISNQISTAATLREVRLDVVPKQCLTIAPPMLVVTNLPGKASQRMLAIGNDPEAGMSLSFQLLPRETGRTTPLPDPALAPRDFTTPAEGIAYRPGRLLVRFAAGQTPAARAALLAQTGASIERDFPLAPGLSVVALPGGTSIEEALRVWNRLPDVLYAEPDYEVRAAIAPDDERFPLMWGLDNTGESGGTPDADIDAPEAWDLQTGSRSMVVAVIDTGVDYAHEDLAANMWRNPGEIPGNGVDDDGNGYVDDVHGVNAITRTGDPMDDNDHGTHVAGAIGAAGNNGVGVAGVCWNTRLMALKFLDAEGRGWSSDAIACLEYATLKGAKVVNVSAGTQAFQQAMKDAVDAAGAAGIMVCAAAGNYGTDMDDPYDGIPSYPAAFDSPNVISVMATDEYDTMPWYSSYGQLSVDLGAPGELMLNCRRGGGYAYMSGTSMATPLVAGACALLWSHNSRLGVAAVKDALLDTVDVPEEPLMCLSGGRLNVARALARAGSFWLTADPAAATDMPSGAVTNVTVGFDAGFLPSGIYSGELAVVSNDRAMPQTNVPCIMMVALDDLGLSPLAGLSAGGPRGGPFIPDTRVYTLTNRGAADVHWTVSCTQNWSTVAPAGGTLAPGFVCAVTARLAQVANTLAAGSYVQTVVFENLDSGARYGRDLGVTVAATSNADNLVISPLTGLAAAGPVGGPFSPSNATYRLVNAGAGALNWRARATTNWFSLTATNGTLAAGAVTNVTVWLNALANDRPVGVHAGRVAFSNATSGVAQSVDVSLVARPYPVMPFSPNIPSGTAGVPLGTNLTWNDTGATSLVGAAAASALDVLVCGSYQPAMDDVRNKLLAAAQFHSVTNVDPHSVTLTLAQLQAFDAVLLGPGDGYLDSNAWGNVMADYHDAGGGVACMLLECAQTAMGGRWLEQGYRTMPLGSYIWNQPATLGTVHQPQHPIMWGVTSFHGGNYSWRPSTTTILSGSVRVANWSDGRPLVVTKTVNGRPRADLAFYPPSSDQHPSWWNASTDGGRLMANALLYVAEASYSYGCRYDLYFGTEPAPTNRMASGLKKTRFDPGPLLPGTTYYWRVVSSNEVGVATGAVWTFTTTMGTPPGWLARYGLTNAVREVEEILDRDGDGLKAWEEYSTGTDPTNPLSFFRVLGFSMSGGLPTVSFYGTTNSGLTWPFGMRRSTNLFEPGIRAGNPIPRNSTGTNTWIDEAPPAGPVFYRPVAEPPAP